MLASYRYTSLIAALAVTAPVHAHSGGLNADGCHAGAQPYHCHGAQGATSTQRVRSRPAASTGDMNCIDFATQRDAQAFYFAAGPGDRMASTATMTALPANIICDAG